MPGLGLTATPKVFLVIETMLEHRGEELGAHWRKGKSQYMDYTVRVRARPLAWVLLCSGRHTPLLGEDPLPTLPSPQIINTKTIFMTKAILWTVMDSLSAP